LRWGTLARFPFEQDELYTLQESRELFATTLLPGIDARPLYYLLHHLVTPLLPPTELGARLPAFLFGIAGLALTWRLGQRLAGEAAGFLALTLAVVSPWHLYISGEARYYSLVYLLAVLVVLVLLRIQERDRWSDAGLLAVLLVAGTLTHPSFAFPMAGIALATFVDPGQLRPRWPGRRLLFGAWVPAATGLLLYFATLRALGRGGAVANWSGRGWAATVSLLPAMAQLVTLSVLAASAAGIIIALLPRSSIRSRAFGLVALGGAFAGATLLLLASTRTNVYADYGAAMLPLAFGAVAGVVLLPGTGRPGAVAGLLAFILTMGGLPETISQLSDGMRFDYRPAFQRISAAGPDRPALVWPRVVQQHYAPELRTIEFRYEVGQLDSVARTVPEFWVVASYHRQGMVGQAPAATEAWLSRHCRSDFTSEGKRFDYRIYRVTLFACSGVPPARR
jgi:hypothetical protein